MLLEDRKNHRSLAAEAFFKQMLYLERKRSERTGEPFVLMLVEAGPAGAQARMMEKVGSTLASSTRETDVTGWHEYQRSIGVILTILRGRTKDEIQSAILQRTYAALSESIGSAQLNKLRISFHFFPEDGKPGKPVGTSENVLYPELKRWDYSQKLFVALKRLTDVVASIALLILLSPIFLVIYL
jgi:hypothetical protein